LGRRVRYDAGQYAVCQSTPASASKSDAARNGESWLVVQFEQFIIIKLVIIEYFEFEQF